MSEDLNSAKCVVYGLAIGDALGRDTEFMSFRQIKSSYGQDGITDLPEPALFTDDTQMSVAIAEALVRDGEKDLKAIMEAVREEFVKWYHSPENNRSPGRTCLTGVANMEQGTHWSKSGVAGSKGCGSAMRSAPIGYLYQRDPEKLKQVAHATGICTHGHPAADAACIGAAYLVKLALDSLPFENMIPKLLSFTKGISGEWDDAILKIEQCLAWEDEEKAFAYLGEGWVGEEAVALVYLLGFQFQKRPLDQTRSPSPQHPLHQPHPRMAPGLRPAHRLCPEAGLGGDRCAGGHGPGSDPGGT